MKTHSITLAVLLCASSWALIPNANAILIGFEAGEGYSAGNLKGQPSSGTTWTNASAGAGLLVTAGAGTSGSQAAVANNTASNFYSFAPSNADLGGTFSPTTSKLAFSFDYKLSANATYLGIAYFRIGTTNGNVLRLSFYNNGNIVFSNGVGSSTAKVANGTDNFFGAAGIYYSISGELDYFTQTYTLSVNNVAQSVGGNSNFGFVSSSSSNGNDLNILSVNTADANWRSYSIDNISYAAVPEPTTSALLFLGLGGLFSVLRRRKHHA